MKAPLIDRLRSVDHGSVEDCFLQSHLFAEAAETLEAAEADSEHWQNLFESTRASMQQDINRLEREIEKLDGERAIYFDMSAKLEARALAAESALAELRKQMLADEGQSREALAAERERCAKIAEAWRGAAVMTPAGAMFGANTPNAIAAAIRAQGE